MANFTDVWCPCGLVELFEEAGVPSNHPLHAKMKSAATSFLAEEMGLDSVDQLIAHSAKACDKFVKCLDVPKAKQKVIRDALKQKKTESGIPSNPRGCGRRIDYDASIRFVQNNPKREGSKPYARYELYKAATTRREFLDFGGLPRDFNADFRAGYVSFVATWLRDDEAEWHDADEVEWHADEAAALCNESLERNLMEVEDLMTDTGGATPSTPLRRSTRLAPKPAPSPSRHEQARQRREAAEAVAPPQSKVVVIEQV